MKVGFPKGFLLCQRPFPFRIMVCWLHTPCSRETCCHLQRVERFWCPLMTIQRSLLRDMKSAIISQDHFPPFLVSKSNFTYSSTYRTRSKRFVELFLPVRACIQCKRFISMSGTEKRTQSLLSDSQAIHRTATIVLLVFVLSPLLYPGKMALAFATELRNLLSL